MKISAVYVLNNETKGVFYIGSSSNVKHRLSYHKWALKNGKHSNPKFQAVFEAADCIRVTVLLADNVEHALSMEEELLKLHQHNPKCCNIALQAKGGDNLTRHPDKEKIVGKITTSIRDRYSKLSRAEVMRLHSRPGQTNPMFGRTHTKAAREAMSKAMMGRVPPNKGVPSTPENKKRMSEMASKQKGEKNPFYGRRHTEETKRLIREANKGSIPPNARPIVVDGVQYTSAQEASRKLDINYLTVRYRASSPNPKFVGYYFVDKRPTTSESATMEMDNGDE